MSAPEICSECFEEFRYDDIGGYNPPCRCGMQCRECCAARCADPDLEDDDSPDDFDPDAPDLDAPDPYLPGWVA